MKKFLLMIFVLFTANISATADADFSNSVETLPSLSSIAPIMPQYNTSNNHVTLPQNTSLKQSVTPAQQYYSAKTVSNPVVKPQKSDFSQCINSYKMGSEELLYSALSALNKMNYQIKEIQSQTGSILFQAASKEFLITISNENVQKSFIKILPTDGNYTFSPQLVQNIFAIIANNSSVQKVF